MRARPVRPTQSLLPSISRIGVVKYRRCACFHNKYAETEAGNAQRARIIAVKVASATVVPSTFTSALTFHIHPRAWTRVT